MNQREKIIAYINRYGGITPMDAFMDLGITKLATRISEMKRDGILVDTEMVTGKNRDGKPMRYARYSNVRC